MAVYHELLREKESNSFKKSSLAKLGGKQNTTGIGLLNIKTQFCLSDCGFDNIIILLELPTVKFGRFRGIDLSHIIDSADSALGERLPHNNHKVSSQVE